MRHADQPDASETVHVDAPAEAVWPFVSDISFVVAPSEELQHVAWEADGGDDAPRVGRRFVGRNRNSFFGEWETTSTVVECDEPRAFGWVVGDVDEPNTRWRFTLTPAADGGTEVTQWVQLGIGPSGITVAVERMPDKEEKIVANRMAQFRSCLRTNLDAVKTAAEAAARQT